jgi:sigma-E factor negative regulatory protein RseC
MMEEEGRVIANDGRFAIIHTERGTSCDSCHAKASCHSMSDTGGKAMEMRAVNDIGASRGDIVKVAIDSTVLLKSSFLVYIVPVVIMIIFGVIGDSYARNNMPGSDPDLVAGAVGITAFIITFLLIKVWSRSLDNKPEYQPRIIKIIGSSSLHQG